MDLSIDEKVVAIIAKTLSLEADEIDNDLAIGDLPQWDSLHHLTIIKNLEQSFQIKYKHEDLMEIEDVADLISTTKDTLAEK